MLCVAAAAGGDTFQHNAPETPVAHCARRASHRPAQMPRGGCLRARGQTYVRSCKGQVPQLSRATRRSGERVPEGERGQAIRQSAEAAAPAITQPMSRQRERR